MVNGAVTMNWSARDEEPPARIGVVDDDVSVRHALVNLLEASGYRWSVFDSGEAFLASPDLDGIDVAVFDVKLRGISGFVLQQRFASLGLDVPVLFISGHSDRDMEQRALRMGAIALLRKPVDPDELLEHIERALERRCAS
jgi:FixJ family two-component response regulator